MREEEEIIHKAIFQENSGEVPDDFVITDSQWVNITKEIPRVIETVKEINPDIKDSIQLREKIQKGLIVRLYEITQVAREVIEKQDLREIPIQAFSYATKGAFIIITISGSIYYIEKSGSERDYSMCKNFDRQSYYQLKVSDDTRIYGYNQHKLVNFKRKVSDEELPVTQIQNPSNNISIDLGEGFSESNIFIKIVKQKSLKVAQKEIRSDQSYKYKTMSISSKISKIYTSPQTESTLHGYETIVKTITSSTSSFISDITHF